MSEDLDKIIQHKQELRAKKKHKLNVYPIQEGLEDEIIDFIKGKELTEMEQMDLEDRLEAFFYGSKLKCRKRTYFFDNGFEFYVTNLTIDYRKLQHIRDSFPKFFKIEVSSEIDQGFSSLAVRLTL